MKSRMLCIVMAILATASLDGASIRAEIEPLVVHDQRLVAELLASEPDLVTPTGVAVDRQGRIYVVENNTHFPPPDYSRSPHDRILRFEDADADGTIDKPHVFLEGLRDTMNIGLHSDGMLFVATRSQVLHLTDADGDGQAESRQVIARLETDAAYPHNGLSGFAFAPDGSVYFGMGENEGLAFRLVGSDGTALSGGGEGGNIYQCQADGSKLRQLATGFWNPFHVCLDSFGRLFVVDNDPDSRPPCRLLHIVDGGDYGYRYRNGRKGLHPFTSWDGELPGTLGMVAGTGEAPSGIVAYESDGLPDEFYGALLATSWGDHRIERFRLSPRGASWTSQAETIVSGGEHFRPVGIAIAPDGSLIVSDWVDKSYEAHGFGRLWRIRARDALPVVRPADHRQAVTFRDCQTRWAAARRLAAGDDDARTYLKTLARDHADALVRVTAVACLAEAGELSTIESAIADDRAMEVQSLAAGLIPIERGLKILQERGASAGTRDVLLRRWRPGDGQVTPVLRQTLQQAIETSDPFLFQAAVLAASRLSQDMPAFERTGALPVQERLAAVLAARHHDGDGSKVLASALADPAATVRFAAVQWIAEKGLQARRNDVAALLAVEPMTPLLFEGCLAALEILDRGYRSADLEFAGEDYVAELLTQDQLATATLAMGLRVLRPDHPALTVDRLETWASSAAPEIRYEAICSLRQRMEPEARLAVVQIADDSQRSIDERAAAIVGLTGVSSEERDLLMRLTEHAEQTLALEAIRSLRGSQFSPDESAALRRLAATRSELSEAVRFALDGPPPAPTDFGLADWLAATGGEGSPRAGERLFFHARGPNCAKCHTFEGRGGRFGPDLTATAGQLSRPRLVESIVRPSKEVAPRYMTWIVQRTDGTVLTGMLVGQTVEGEHDYLTPQGQVIRVPSAEIEQRAPHEASIMPEELCAAMTVSEFRDLLAFLTLGVRQASTKNAPAVGDAGSR